MKALGTLLVALSLVAAGCGGDDASEEPAKPATTEAPAQTSAEESGAKPAAKASADIKDFEYDPLEITVAEGGKVTWTNQDSANHNVKFDDSSIEGIGNLRQGDEGAVTFAKAGSFAYVCTYHPNMKATVVVK